MAEEATAPVPPSSDKVEETTEAVGSNDVATTSEAAAAPSGDEPINGATGADKGELWNTLLARRIPLRRIRTAIELPTDTFCAAADLADENAPADDATNGKRHLAR